MMITREEVCCDRMWLEIESFNKKELNKDGTLESTIWYEEETRTYHLLSVKTLDDCQGWPIDYCPFCGKKLPEWLYPEDVICEEYGEDYVRLYHDPKYKPLPPEVRKEFDTDEWWKKRGL